MRGGSRHRAQFYSRRVTVSQIEGVLFRGAEALTRINEQVRRGLLSAGAEAGKQQDEDESHSESLRVADLSPSRLRKNAPRQRARRKRMCGSAMRHARSCMLNCPLA